MFDEESLHGFRRITNEIHKAAAGLPIKVRVLGKAPGQSFQVMFQTANVVADDCEFWMPCHHVVPLLHNLCVAEDSFPVVEIPFVVFAKVIIVGTLWIKWQPGINRLGSMNDDG